MDSQTVFASLRDALVKLYPDVASARRIGDDAGIDLGHIHFETSARNYWHGILTEAVHVKRVDRLFDLTLAEYADNPAFRIAYQAYLATGKRLIPPPPPGASKDEQRAYQNRQAMLKLVHDIWVKGVLEHSLYNQLLIDLDMEQRPEAVERPWGMVLETPEQANHLLPPGTKMIDVFTELNQSLLILGEPGSGKSTMLLELARDLLAQATQNPALPMPVLFSLSSWAEKRQPLQQWLVDELREKYQIPKALAQAWVEHDELLLLLDGLDEVKREYREDCIKVLNEFQQSKEERLSSLAICSRIVEYEVLPSKLKLNGAIILRPLTKQQIDKFLSQAGEKLGGVVHLLQFDTELQTLAQSPLTLRILCLTYQGKAMADIELVGGVGTRLQQLFDAYVVGMFQRRGKLIIDRYPRAQTLYWLTWLAFAMALRGKDLFLIKDLQPIWLSYEEHWLVDKQLRQKSRTSWLDDQRVTSNHNRFQIDSYVIRVPTHSEYWMRRYDITFILIIMLIGGLIGGLIAWLSGGLIFELPEGLISGMVLGLLFGLISFNDGSIKPIERLNWSLVKGPFFGLIVCLLLGLLYGLLFKPFLEIIIWQLFGHRGWLRDWLNLEAIIALCFGLYFGLTRGGEAAIKRGILHLFLWLQGSIPLNYARFLDYCADRIFLYKVDGGYKFIHRLLMEHFASLTEEDIKRLAGSSDGR